MRVRKSSKRSDRPRRDGGGLEKRVAASVAALVPGYPKARLCVAFSGGMDSTALLTVLARMRALRGRLRAIHVDHGLQPQSRAWADHCRRVAGELGVPLEVVTVAIDLRGGASLEAAAREARYAALAQRLAAREVLLTAQHADDQLETVLLQLLRGAGVRGIAAMAAVAPFAGGWLVRPLIAIERAEIEHWARTRKLEWVEDESNQDERRDRNYLRGRVVPLLRARWPAASVAVARTARHAAEGQRLLELLARADVEQAADGAALSVRRLRALTSDRRRNALRFWIARSNHPAPDSSRLAEICGPMLEARRDANPSVSWGDAIVQRHADRLTLRRAAHGAALEQLVWPLRRRRVLELPAGLGRLELAPAPRGPIDLALLPHEVTVRPRRGGERLRPRPGGPTRALKSLFRELRLAHIERGRVPLLFDGEHLIAAGDLWVDARVQVRPETKRRARLIWHRA
jgi:tRNA(Ile)-lysidine synthase